MRSVNSFGIDMVFFTVGFLFIYTLLPPPPTLVRDSAEHTILSCLPSLISICNMSNKHNTTLLLHCRKFIHAHTIHDIYSARKMLSNAKTEAMEISHISSKQAGKKLKSLVEMYTLELMARANNER